MKQGRRWILAVLSFLFLFGLGLAGSAQTAQAAAKTGLVKVKAAGFDKDYNKIYDYYYYQKNGAKLKNAWKKISGRYYYFGKNGKAYRADLADGYKLNFKMVKIKGKSYGFDTQARRISGIWVLPSNGKLFVFDKNGVYNKTKTAALRTAAKKDKASAAFLKLLGTYKKRQVYQHNCVTDDGSREVHYTYANIEVVTLTDTSNTPEKNYIYMSR